MARRVDGNGQRNKRYTATLAVSTGNSGVIATLLRFGRTVRVAFVATKEDVKEATVAWRVERRDFGHRASCRIRGAMLWAVKNPSALRREGTVTI